MVQDFLDIQYQILLKFITQEFSKLNFCIPSILQSVQYFMSKKHGEYFILDKIYLHFVRRLFSFVR